jgi:hypothetical protein
MSDDNSPSDGLPSLGSLVPGSELEKAAAEDPSRHHFWNAYNCGYQAYRQGKLFGANPYYNDELESRWSAGCKDTRKACTTGKGPFDGQKG